MRVRRRTRGQPGLTGAALEQAVMHMRQIDPGLVALPGEPVRRMKAKR